jgi:hypothetical protein
MMILMNKKIKIKFAELLDICSAWKMGGKALQGRKKWCIIFHRKNSGGTG